MKLLRFGPAGSERPGMLDAEGRVRDLSSVIPDITGATIGPDSLAKLAALDPATLPVIHGEPRLGACVANSPKFVAVGLNYSDHAAESNMPIPAEPILFGKATSCIVGPNDDVMLPMDSVKLDWEVELGIVIGTKARYVEEAKALDYVAGYCVINDVSEREYQLERSGQWTKGKGCDTFGPIGPWLVTKDEIPNVSELAMFCDVNGERRQTGSTATMIFHVPFLVSYISRFMTLMPGDLIATGTPPGVGLGMKPPLYLKAGDEMRLGIAGLGEQRQKVVPFKL
ncbi:MULTISPECIES: fumarylacetoacetate hydrolase family protein [Rhodomicrobium]|uniref:fumarylacetoacetate hydrolase family protein n=1 Tax=Rhodomicrobium TaxID=1068 RepID=UPI000B4B6D28|nr:MULTISPECIES: fumarylacetoacetate hydrolase family protein [Rhodomicrobium]